MNGWRIAVILGAVEGLTEFLPISSTGHLIIAGHLLGFVGDRAASFQVAIQLGAIFAVVLLYWRRFARLVPHGVSRGMTPHSAMDGWAGLSRVALATFPALAVAYMARHAIKQHLFNPEAVTLALVVGGVAILLVERHASASGTNNNLDQLSLSQALGVGLFQILALWPGTSRAAATIIGGMLVGLDRKSAAEFSFLIAVPVLFAASGYELITMRDQLNGQEGLNLGIGFVVSFLVALIAVKSFVRFLERGKLTPFAWYRIIVAPIFHYLTRGAVL
jgi:undecaprenyl-diphosphatase